MTNQKQKASVFVALFTMNERDGWLSPGLAQFFAALSHVAKDRRVMVHLSACKKPIDHARNLVVKEFLASGCDWLLMVDNDMVPPLNLFEMIDRAAGHMDILVPKFFMLAPAFGPRTSEALTKHAQNPRLPLFLCWQTLNIRLDEREWTELAWAGTGVMFIRRRVFGPLGNCGWFKFVTDADGAWIFPEDFEFCRRAREAGFSVWGNQRFEADHFHTVSLSALAQSVGTLLSLPLNELLAKGQALPPEITKKAATP